MLIQCAICNTHIKSLDVDRDRAIKEVSNRLSNHIIHNHPDNIKQLQLAISKLTQMLVWYYLLTQTGKIPDYEDYFISKVEDTRIELAKILGIQIIGRDDEIELVPLPNNEADEDELTGKDGDTEDSEDAKEAEEKAY